MDKNWTNFLTIHIAGWLCLFLILIMIAGSGLVSWKATILMVFILPLMFLIVLKPLIGFYFLILFVPVTALQLKTDILNSYLPHRLEVVTMRDFYVYHIIVIAAFTGWFLKKFGGLFEGDFNKLSLKNLLIFAFSLLSFWFMLSILWAPNRISGLLHLIQFLINIGLFYFAITIISTKEIAYKVLIVWILIGVIFAGSAIIDRVYVTSLPDSIERTLILTFNYPIFEHLKLGLSFRLFPVRASGLSTFDQTSAFINMTMPLTFLLLIKKDTWIKLIGAVSLFIMIFARGLIPNKAGIGAFIIMGLFLIIKFRPTRKQFFKSVVIFILIIALTYFLSQLSFERVADMSRLSKTASLEGHNSLTIRLVWWKTALNILLDRYYGLGLGAGGFKYYIAAAPHAHGVIQSFFFDLGIIGLIGILLILIVIGREFYMLLNYQNTDLQIMTFFYCCGVIAFVIQGLVDFEYHMGWMWLYLGTAVATLNLARQEIKSLNLNLRG